MPFIQVDVRAGLSQEQRALLTTRIVDIVHDAIGSARAHINVAVREIEPGGLIEAGQPVTAGDVGERPPALP
jgi:phenylpyruvate tautomerase PptA (4-oxalocrotonate tautomerase family)